MVEKLHDDACMDYVKRMQQRKIKQVCSKPVSLCLNYIYSHMHEKISTEELAAEVHLHPSYLSRLFREQMGCTLHDYILDQKIQSAKRMLQFSDRSYAEIANLLAFSSQSYLTGLFQKSRCYAEAVSGGGISFKTDAWRTGMTKSSPRQTDCF
ncbi:MAG: helix-turn-helix transcriptional regulator [Ruminococcus callidus]